MSLRHSSPAPSRIGYADQRATAGRFLNRVALIGSQIGVGYVAIQSHDVFLYASMIFSIASR
ncbi:hypothetical protein NKI38_27945 [Mesorhizobium sp. M0621]|uniref:hypothetical protein n=1 Tax=Mesorhizobium sp. M0621 TaxID=2956974 RepID=UPI003336D164